MEDWGKVHKLAIAEMPPRIERFVLSEDDCYHRSSHGDHVTLKYKIYLFRHGRTELRIEQINTSPYKKDKNGFLLQEPQTYVALDERELVYLLEYKSKIEGLWSFFWMKHGKDEYDDWKRS